LYERFAHLIREVGKFGIVGGVCYIIDLSVFITWNHVTGQRYVATIVSTLISTSVAFVGNRFWTWRHRERSSLRREYLLYFGFNTVGLGIGIVCLFISSHWLGALWPSIFATPVADVVSGKVIGVLLASFFRFWAYRRFVFRLGSEPTASA
jgi:putative flippase GtrA